MIKDDINAALESDEPYNGNLAALTRALAEIERLEAQRDEAMADAARLRRLREMESQVSMSENKVCYYLRNINELDRLIKLDAIAKGADHG